MLTQDRLKELLHYNPLTGTFTWLPRDIKHFICKRTWSTWHSNFANKVAGNTSPKGYRTIRIALYGDKSYLSHRLAWLYVYGEWPKEHIDHINGNRSDNRIINLRDVDRLCNAQNQRTTKRESKLPLGVYFYKNKPVRPYSASLRVDYKVKFLGYFDTPEEAHDVYVKAKRLYHKGCTI